MAKRGMVKCKECGYTIYSRARHDFHWCPCKTVAIDGGNDYVKICGHPDHYTCLGERETGFTEHQLHADWNLGLDLLGSFPDTAVCEMTTKDWEAEAWKKFRERSKKK